MCRHLAYVGAPVRLGALLSDPPHSLVRQSWAPRHQDHGVVNADGFGIGWYVDDVAEPARHRAAGPIWADETFVDLARVLRSGAVLAAVRSATVGMSGGQSAAAPFRSGPWLFSHNGAVFGWPQVASRLAWGLDPGELARLEAPTDSALLWAMTRDLLGRGKPPDAALTEVVSRVAEAGGGRLTFLLTDGKRITATAWGTGLYWRVLPHGLVVASEPYDDDPAWTPVPDRSLLEADASGAVVTPLTPRA
ncbi:ergothioneine biosynthesis protein EgtC [Nakamurella sp. GG22]